MISRKRKRISSDDHKAALEPYKEEDLIPVQPPPSSVAVVEWRDRTRDEFTREYMMIEM